MSCQRNGGSLFVKCGKRPECPEKRATEACSEQTIDIAHAKGLLS